MIPLEQHTLIGVDASGSLCACGVKGDWREHLADVLFYRACAWISELQLSSMQGVSR